MLEKLKEKLKALGLVFLEGIFIYLAFTWPFWLVFLLITLWTHCVFLETIITSAVVNLIYALLGYPQLD